MKNLIDNLVIYLWGYTEKARNYQILLYRRRLNKTPKECHEIFGLSTGYINYLCKNRIDKTDPVYLSLNLQLDKTCPEIKINEHKTHMQSIINRMKIK